MSIAPASPAAARSGGKGICGRWNGVCTCTTRVLEYTCYYSTISPTTYALTLAAYDHQEQERERNQMKAKQRCVKCSCYVSSSAVISVLCLIQLNPPPVSPNPTLFLRIEQNCIIKSSNLYLYPPFLSSSPPPPQLPVIKETQTVTFED